MAELAQAQRGTVNGFRKGNPDVLLTHVHQPIPAALQIPPPGSITRTQEVTDWHAVTPLGCFGGIYIPEGNLPPNGPIAGLQYHGKF